MSKEAQAVVILAGALALGAIAHQVAGREAAVLGLSVLELALLSAAVGAVTKRTLAGA